MGSPTERLADERNIWVATTRPDGRPHLAPVWFVYVDDRIWVGTGRTAVRIRNALANPTAAVSLENGDQPVVAECRARVHLSLRPPAVAAAFEAKYGWDITIDVDDDVGEVVLLELEPVKWLFDVELPTTA